MRQIFLVLFLAAITFGQTIPIRVAPAEAAKHLLKHAEPFYPRDAEAGRIMGVVVFEINIDETGAVSGHRLVSGHPMLVPAAEISVKGWKYEPFQVDGKPSAVSTFVAIAVPSQHDAKSAAELSSRLNFYFFMELAGASLAKSDFVAADTQLSLARDTPVPNPNGSTSKAEDRWEWVTAMGQLRVGQQKYDEGKAYYERGLALIDHDDKDSPKLAATHAYLGNLYVKQNRNDQARESFARSQTIYEKNFKKSSNNPTAEKAFGRTIAQQAWTLSRLALQENDAADTATQCHVLLDFQTFLDVANRDAYITNCQQTIAASQNGKPH